MRNWLTKTVLLALALVLGCAVLLIGCGGDAAEEPSSTAAAGEPKTLVMGSVMPLSGPLSVVGLAWNRGYELYFEKVNEEGGIKVGSDTYTVKFVAEDGKGAAEAAGAAARKLVSQDGATFLFGEIMDAATIAIYDVAEQNQVLQAIPSLNVAGSPADVAEGKDFLARPNVGFDDAHTADLDFLKKTYPDVKTIAISAIDIGYEPMIESFTRAAEARGFEVNYVEKWAWGIEDFVPTYTRILASEPDAIFIMVSGQSAYQLMAARQLGFKGPVFANSPLGPEVHIRIAGPETTDFFCNGLNPEDPTPVMADIMARYEEKYHEEWITDAVQGWDEGWVVVQAIEKAQSVDPAAVMAALETMTATGDLQTTYGDGNMTGLERFGVNRVLAKPIPITYIMDGKMTMAGYFDSAPE